MLDSACETTTGLCRKLKISVPANKVMSQVDERIKSLGKTLKVPGFRSGKVPVSFLKKKYQSQVYSEITEKLINETLQEELKNKEFKPIQVPKVDIIINEQNKPLEYEATFEIYPTIPIIDLSSIQVKMKQAEINDKDIDDQINLLQKSRINWKESKDAIKVGDKVVAKSTCILKGSSAKKEDDTGGLLIKEFSQDNFTIIIGDDKQYANINKSLLNKNNKDIVNVKQRLPRANNKSWSEQEANFSLEVVNVEQGELPAVDESFCKEIGVDSGKVDDLRKQVKDSLLEQAEKLSKEDLKQEIFKVLLDKYEVELPVSMLEVEEKSECFKAGYKSSDEIPINKRKEIVSSAKESVKLGLLVGGFVNQHQIKVENEKVYEKVSNIVQMYGGDKNIAEKVVNNKDIMQKITAEVLEEGALEVMMQSVKIDKVKVEFSMLRQENN